MYTILFKLEQKIFPLDWQAPGVVDEFTLSPQGVA